MTAVAIDSNGSPDLSVTDYNAWMESQPGWAAQPNVISSRAGFGVNDASPNNKVEYSCQVSNSLGMVLTMGFCTTLYMAVEYQSPLYLTVDPVQTDNLSVINQTIISTATGDSYVAEIKGDVSFTLTQETFDFDFTARISGSGLSYTSGPVMHWWTLESPDQYLMRSHIQQQRQIDSLRTLVLRRQMESNRFGPSRTAED